MVGWISRDSAMLDRFAPYISSPFVGGGSKVPESLGAELRDKLRHVLSLIRSARRGKDYDARWGERMTGDGPYAWMIGRRFELAAERLGFNRRRQKLRTDLFVPPFGARQLALF